MDLREIYGVSPWHRMAFEFLAEEVARISHAAQTSGMTFALPAEVTEASADGHSVTVQSTVKKAIKDPVTNEVSYEDLPIAPDVPIHYPGGGGTVLTHGLAVGDELAQIFFSRNIDGWRQLSGIQQPYDGVQNHLGDSVAIPGIRSDPRRLQQVDGKAAHLRSDDKTVVHEVHPSNGVQSFHADPSTPAASPDFDPLSQAGKFLSHVVQAARGIMGRAVDGSTEHSHGVDHGVGAWMKAMAPSGLVQALAHPALGALISAADGKNSVTATSGGVMLQSPTSIAMNCPLSGFSMPAGAAAASVGLLSGDLSGTLPNVEVTSLAHVDARSLPVATSDAAAAAAGVPVGGLYRDTSIASGKQVIVMRAV